MAAVPQDGRGSQQQRPRVGKHLVVQVAAVPQDGRGSQQAHGCRAHGRYRQWRPSPRTAEDRNLHGSGGPPPGHVVAAVPQDGRGSQHLTRRGNRDPERRWRPSPRTAEDRNTCSCGARGCPGQLWRPSPRTAEDRNISDMSFTARSHQVAAVPQDGRGSQHLHPDVPLPRRPRRGGRPPGRPRIATPPAAPPRRRRSGWRPSPRTAEDRNISGGVPGRDSVPSGGRPPGRPRIATNPSSRVATGYLLWRPSPRTAEDRNILACLAEDPDRAAWRPSPRTAEDRNSSNSADRFNDCIVAAVPQDGRGSQQLQLTWPSGCGQEWRPSPRTAEDRNPEMNDSSSRVAVGGGRPPGRPRIATDCGVS